MCTKKKDLSDLQQNERKLTTSQLRKHKGFENIDETDAILIIDALYQLSLLCYSIYKSKSK